MATRPRSSKRVRAIRRAHDGSAFEKCERCGVLVAIALLDMHECEPNRDVKRFRGINGKQAVVNQSFADQPVSPFRLFMESFMMSCKTGNLIENDRRGCETWKNMTNEVINLPRFLNCNNCFPWNLNSFSLQERQPYVSQAEKINSAYQNALDKEVNDMIQVNDEADSAMVGKFDKFQYFYEESSEYCSSEEYDSFNTDEWDVGY